MLKKEKERKFLEQTLGDYNSKEVSMAPWQNRVVVRDPNIFHKIAKASGVREIKKTENFLHFEHNPSGIKGSVNSWDYELVEGKEEFLKRYKKKYKIK